MADHKYPRQDIPESEKNEKWCAEHLDYAVDHYISKQQRVAKLTRLYRNYNGKNNELTSIYLTAAYGKESRIKFKNYRLARPKIDLVHGEWLKRPLSTTVTSINKDAKVRKLKRFQSMIGMAHGKPELEKLKKVVGVDVFNGMEIPDAKNEKDIFNRLNIKEKNEVIQELAIKDQIENKDLDVKLAENFKDLEITSEMHGKVEITEDADVIYRDIDPRNAIFIEVDRDPYLKKTLLKGERRGMFIEDIIKEFPELNEPKNKEKKEEIRNMQGNMGNLLTGYPNYYKHDGKRLLIETFTIEWKSQRPVITKIIPDPKDPSGEPFKKEIAPETFEKNRDKIMKDVKKGKFKIQTRWKDETWEATRVGHNINLQCRIKPNAMRRVDKPSEAIFFYTSLLFNTIDGERVSLMELMEEVEHQYNVVIYQINKEITKAKGKVIVYDEAQLPRKKTIKDVLYDVTEDSLLLVNSAQDGNRSGQNLKTLAGIEEIDLSVSETINVLLNILIFLERTADKISGINENREGLIPASATATNAQSSIIASRTITEPMFYFASKYVELVMTKIAEATKVAWGILGSKRAETIIGDAGVNFLKVTRDLADDDYVAYMVDGKKELELRDLLGSYINASLNSKELRIQDALKAQMQDTITEAAETLEAGWEKVQEIRRLEAKEARDAQERISTAVINDKKEDREDTQVHEKELAILKIHGDTSELARRVDQTVQATEEAAEEGAEIATAVAGER